MPYASHATPPSRRWLAAACLLAAACSEGPSTQPDALQPDAPLAALQAVECQADVRAERVSCGAPRLGGASGAIIGGQNVNVKLTSSNVSFDSGTGIFSFDVTVQNLMPEAIGTPDGVTPDTAGIRVFFATGPAVTAGTGTATAVDVSGTATFLAPNQAYMRYDEVLSRDEVSPAKSWRIQLDPGVSTFNFRLYVAAELQPLLVINEMMVNPLVSDATGEWFELYNAGRADVQLEGLFIADSAGMLGRAPYRRINAPLTVPSGGYVVFGNTTNTATNGGVPVDYAYAAQLALANSLDAVKIARVYGTDTLTIDRAHYSSSATSALNGIGRELKNPALDNSDVDGENWAHPLESAVYGAGGRGTPKAQNSTFTP